MQPLVPGRKRPDQAHPFCNNANAAIRRSAWESYPYDEELTGLEDMAWANAALEARGGHRVCRGSSRRSRPPRAMGTAHEPIPARGDRAPAHPARPTDREARRDPLGVREHRQRLPACGAGAASWSGTSCSIPWFRSAQFLGTYQGFAQRGDVSSVLRRRFYYPNGVRRRSRAPESTASPVGRSTTTRSAAERAEQERRDPITGRPGPDARQERAGQGKNYRELGGRPLYHHIVSTLLACPSVDRVVIDTDSAWITDDAARGLPGCHGSRATGAPPRRVDPDERRAPQRRRAGAGRPVPADALDEPAPAHRDDRARGPHLQRESRHA